MSRVMIDGVILTPSQEQAFYLDMETEGSRTPAQLAEAEELQALEDMMSESGIRRVEQLLDGEQMRRVLTLTPEAWRHMSAPERAWVPAAAGAGEPTRKSRAPHRCGARREERRGFFEARSNDEVLTTPSVFPRTGGMASV